MDDEDGYTESEGSGDDPGVRKWEEPTEGSGMHSSVGVVYKPFEPKAPLSPYDNVPPPNKPPKRGSSPPQRVNPSAAPAEKPMSLTWAVAVYLLPAVFTFLGTIG